ncbi:hypothetical protein PT974_07100 [Cladobotryum mycophilum]|uniref:Uncharacterized protein n=1 Tax=Cladobotryum mycophilum TaxID=491253 RepID=A0ABR0SPJ7_9HYPO
MDDTISVIKTLILPASISLLIFLLLTFVLIPLWRRYRNRYSQYLPLDAISSQTSSLRHRLSSYLFNLAFVSTWRRNRDLARASASASAAADDEPDIDVDGEELSAVDVGALRAWEAHARNMRPEYTRRLSRELEEGFRDDSDEESDL